MEPENEPSVMDIVNGFFGGLAAAGVTNVDPRPAEFEAAFSRAWTAWAPASSGKLSRLSFGRYGYKTVLYQARSPESFFGHYRTSIRGLLMGTDIDQFLRTWAGHATPSQWQDLAHLYMGQAKHDDHVGLRQPAPSRRHGSSPPTKEAIAVRKVMKNGIRVPGGLIRSSNGTTAANNPWKR